MEMHDLKKAWIALDNRLKRNEKLEESIILEMMRSKAGKTVNRFVAYEMFTVALVLFFVPFLFFTLTGL